MIISHSDCLTMSYRCNNDFDWTMNVISKESEDVLEYPYEEIVSNNVTFGGIISQIDIETVRKSLENAIYNSLPFQVAYEIKTANAGHKFLFEQGQANYNEEGRVVELIGFVSDVGVSKDPHALIEQSLLVSHWKDEVSLSIKHFNLKTTTKRIKDITESEVIIALHFTQGMSMKEIAVHFCLPPRTIEGYLNRIQDKLGCYSKSQLRRLIFETKVGKKLILNSLH